MIEQVNDSQKGGREGKQVINNPNYFSYKKNKKKKPKPYIPTKPEFLNSTQTKTKPMYF